MVEAPNRYQTPPYLLLMESLKKAALKGAPDALFAESWKVRVGPPKAELAVAIVEPGDYKLKQEWKNERDPNGREKIQFRIRWTVPDKKTPLAPKGTIVLLHGIQESKESMVCWAVYLAQKGYRVVLVDLRGHGGSTGKWITYGAVESNDLSELMDELQRRGLADGRVGLLGVSYGASVGLLWAARDPRVAAIVALEPYREPRQAMVEFLRAAMKKKVARFSDADFAWAAQRAAQMADFSWSNADPGKSINQIHVPVLFFHGLADTWVPARNSEELYKNAAAGSRLVLLPDDNHLTLSFRLEPIAADVAAWFDAHLTASPAGVAAAVGQRRG